MERERERERELEKSEENKTFFSCVLQPLRPGVQEQSLTTTEEQFQMDETWVLGWVYQMLCRVGLRENGPASVVKSNIPTQ